jgi:hypothetical protein
VHSSKSCAVGVNERGWALWWAGVERWVDCQSSCDFCVVCQEDAQTKAAAMAMNTVSRPAVSATAADLLQQEQ